MKKYLTPECDLIVVASKEDLLTISVTINAEGEAPVVSFNDNEKWEILD